MRELLIYGFTQGASSFLPILMWFLIGIVYGDKDLMNVFTISYPFQFIWTFLHGSIIKGSLVRENKDGIDNRDTSWSSVVVSTIMFMVISAVVVLNRGLFFKLMGVDGSYTLFFIYALICLGLNLLIGGTVLVLQFSEDGGKGFKLTIWYYVIQVVSIVGFRVLIDSNAICVVLSTVVCSVSALYVLLSNMNIVGRFTLNVFKGMKYRIGSMASDICMFIVYSLGLGNVLRNYPDFLVTYNIMALCTDTQWDMQGEAVDVKASILVSTGTFETEKKRLFLNCTVFSLLLLLSSMVMSIVCYYVYGFNIRYAIVILCMELGTFLLYTWGDICEIWVNVRGDAKFLVYLVIVAKGLRILTSLFLKTKYSLNIGAVMGVVGSIGAILMYKWQRKGRIFLDDVV